MQIKNYQPQISITDYTYCNRGHENDSEEKRLKVFNITKVILFEQIV